MNTPADLAIKKKWVAITQGIRELRSFRRRK